MIAVWLRCGWNGCGVVAVWLGMKNKTKNICFLRHHLFPQLSPNHAAIIPKTTSTIPFCRFDIPRGLYTSGVSGANPVTLFGNMMGNSQRGTLSSILAYLRSSRRTMRCKCLTLSSLGPAARWGSEPTANLSALLTRIFEMPC